MPSITKWLCRLVIGMVLLTSVYSCDEASVNEQNTSGLLREGMSAGEVEKLLGKPEKRDTSGIIYDVNTSTMQKVERWTYEKRTVVFINDTLKSTNIKQK